MKLNISYKKGFVLNPDKYYCPSYRITPFQTSNLVSYHELQEIYNQIMLDTTYDEILII